MKGVGHFCLEDLLKIVQAGPGRGRRAIQARPKPSSRVFATFIDLLSQKVCAGAGLCWGQQIELVTDIGPTQSHKSTSSWFRD